MKDFILFDFLSQHIRNDWIGNGLSISCFERLKFFPHCGGQMILANAYVGYQLLLQGF